MSTIAFFKARRMGKPGCADKICVIVGTVTDDVRLLEVPKLNVSSLDIVILKSCANQKHSIRNDRY